MEAARPSNTTRSRFVGVLAGVLCLAIFTADVLAPDGVAAGVPYVAVVVLTLGMTSAAATWLAAAAGLVLVAAGHALSPPADVSIEFTNRILAAAAILATASLALLRRQGDRERGRAAFEAHELRQRLELLHRISRSCQASLPVDLIVAQVVQELHRTFPRYRAAYCTIDDAGRLEITRCANPDGMCDVQGITMDLSCAPDYVAALRRHECLAIADVEEEPAIAPIVPILLEGDVRALLDMPVLRGPGLVGLLCFDAPAPHAWSAHEIETPREVGDALAVIVKEAEARAEHARAQERLRETAESVQRVNRELERATREAESSNQAKSTFLANMSHEIRTPLTAILGYGEILDEYAGEGKLPDECRESVEAIRQSGEHLLRIINDVLDLSKIEAGKLEVERKSFSVARMLAAIQSILQPRADESGLSLATAFEGPIPATLVSDPLRVRQILINLVGNALKFTSEGGVRIVLSLVRDGSGDEGTLRFDVADTGIGMTEEQAARLFRPFTQAERTIARDYGGTGLGLAISRRLARALGGRLELARTAPGEGSVFRFEIPSGSLDGIEMLDAPPAAPLERSPTREPKRLDCRVLVAEDNLMNQHLLVRLLERAGAEVAVASDGEQALEAILRGQESPRPFDLVLMDMQLPGVDGYAATRNLRGKGIDVPVIALTASALEGDRQKCLAAGCDEHQPKPIDRATLLDTVRRHLPPR